ncbi:MAG: hypothetical protein JOS17DRAFT_305607 [Linnemannia elongata]|nr:MAG: hypothetical protein JOS17DRAFT_305607 [Linnemannia elongata]
MGTVPLIGICGWCSTLFSVSAVRWEIEFLVVSGTTFTSLFLLPFPFLLPLCHSFTLSSIPHPPPSLSPLPLPTNDPFPPRI